ncbi:MAG: three-Cys-motif partner protein TcmP, partial [Planctomycetia bacterium]
MAKDINKKPFDEATQTKLDIFEKYLTTWLPVFIKTAHFKKVAICDFFAGSGQDSKGVAGSPLRIFKTLEAFKEQISKEQINIQVVLNEFDKEKFNELKSTVKSKYNLGSRHNMVNVTYCNKDFQDLFPCLYPQLTRQPNLLFIDQYGIKHVTGDTFQKLISLERTDFLFFLSSSSIKRFMERPEFKEHLPDLDSTTIATAKQVNMHRVMLRYYRKKIPTGNKTKLYPFTIKKGPNIYGLIFGSEHPLGVEKFLDIVWKENELN